MRIIVFGATGMVGQGVVRQALAASDVEKVLMVTRRPTGLQDERLEELIQDDFFDYAAVADKLAGFDACFFCLGVTSAGMNEADYTRLTLDLTVAAARALVAQNPTMSFHYVSGEGTDSSAKGRVMWARVKGKLENELLAMPFGAAYMFRPGFIRPGPGIAPPRAYRALYAVLLPLVPLLKLFLGRHMTTSEAVGDAMLQAARTGYPRPRLENADINALAQGEVAPAPQEVSTARRWMRRVGMAVAAGALVFSATAAALVADAWQAFGKAPADGVRARMEASAQWNDGGFENPQRLWNDIMGSITSGSPEGAVTSPTDPIDVVRGDGTRFRTPPASGLRVTWMGHSSNLVEIDGARVLFDPIFMGRAFPFDWVGPDRWYEPPIPLDKMPSVDAVVISHDHYDHLSFPTISAMKDWETRFITPLGVGAHLRYWGVPADRIIELDWWEAVDLGPIKLVATPARHASGRHLLDQNRTLWAGYALVGPEHRLFYSGDTGLFPAMTEIGERFGPFDVTMIEVGAYHRAWPDWHIGPEQAVRAHQMLRGDVFLPVHWGLWNLALHGWTEPAERVVVAASKADVRLAMPRPGESIEPASLGPVVRWWPTLPWETAEQHPVVSTKSGDPEVRFDPP